MFPPLHQAIIDGNQREIERLVKAKSNQEELYREWKPTALAHYLGGKGLKSLHRRTEPQIYYEGELLTLDGYKQAFNLKYIETLRFQSFDILERVRKKTIKLIARKQSKQLNLWMRAMYAKEVEQGIGPKLSIQWIDPFFGRGVFAEQNIAEFSYIGEYAGIVRKRKRILDKGNDYVFGYVAAEHDTPFVIDARSSGNFVRFVNHSENANLISRWVEVDGLCHVILFANRLIRKGEQLSYNYGPLYWRKRPAPLEYNTDSF